MKYFTQEKLATLKLSQLIEITKDERDLCCLKHMLIQLGDVELSKEMFKTLTSYMKSCGGRYDVRLRPETIKGIYEIICKFPMLTPKAIDEISFIYISDLFEEYDLVKMLDKAITKFGEKDEIFELYLEHVSVMADELAQTYIQESSKTKELEGIYSERFIKYISRYIRTTHTKYEEVKKYLPSSEIIKEDEEHLQKISQETGVYMTLCTPASYTIVRKLIEKDEESISEQPTYYISKIGKKIDTIFTKEQLLASIGQKTKLL